MGFCGGVVLPWCQLSESGFAELKDLQDEGFESPTDAVLLGNDALEL